MFKRLSKAARRGWEEPRIRVEAWVAEEDHPYYVPVRTQRLFYEPLAAAGSLRTGLHFAREILEEGLKLPPPAYPKRLDRVLVKVFINGRLHEDFHVARWPE